MKNQLSTPISTKRTKRSHLLASFLSFLLLFLFCLAPQVWAESYYSSGTITSDNILSGLGVTGINKFGYNVSSLPANTTAKVQFSQDASTWYNSSGTVDGWDTLASGDYLAEGDAIDLSGLGWIRGYFYYQLQFDTSDAGATPVLDEVVVFYDQGPSVDTGADSDVTPATATLTGEVTCLSGGNATSRGFEYGLTETGTWSVSESGDYSAEEFSLDVADLTAGTTYYYRAYAVNPEGTGYGSWDSFTTGTYAASGTIISDNLLSGQSVTTIDEFDYTLSVKPEGATATVQFSQDASTWYNSSDVPDGTDTLLVGANVINLNLLGWSGANFYYKITLTANTALNATPVVDDISVAINTETSAVVGEWRFDEGSGTVANNAGTGGSSLNGAISDADWTDSGKYDKALQFNGTTDYVTISTPITDIRSISFWVKTSDLTTDLVDFDGGTHTITAAAGVVAANGFTSPIIYVDGVRDAVLAADTWQQVLVTTTYADVFDSTTITFGKISGNYFAGYLDEIKIYNYGLSADQVKVEYNRGMAVVLGSGSSTLVPPVAYYKFDEGYGTTANNAGSEGDNLNGTLTNIAPPATSTSGWTNSGKYGKGLVFDGSDDYVSIPDNSALEPDSISVSAWIYKSSAGSTYQGVVDKGRDNYGAWALCVDTPGTGKASFKARLGGTNRIITASTAYPIGQWVHIVGTYNGSTLAIYQNGVLSNSAAYSGALGTNSLKVFIGAANSTGDIREYPFSGSIDEVKIYNYALTAEEVKLDYNQGAAMVLGSLSTDPSNPLTPLNSQTAAYCVPGSTDTCIAPVAEWKFDEGSGQSAQDTSGNANTGTLGSSASSDSSDPLWSSGKVGKALRFDGSDDYIQGTLSNFSPIGAMSVSTWVKTTDTSGYIIDAAYNAFGSFMVWVQSGRIEARFKVSDGSSSTVYYTTNDINENIWHHVEAVYDGATSKLFVDGILRDSDNSITGNLRTTNTSYNIGRAYNSSTYYNGLIDDLRVYNYARTAAQIAWDYNRGGPVGWYKFDETEGTTAYDAAADLNENRKNGTLTNSVTQMASGKLNYAYSFDGTDDFVDVGTGSSVVNAVSFWVKPTTTTEYPIDLNGTAYVWVNGGTVTAQGFTSPTIYVNGKVSSTVTAGSWQYVTVVTDTSLNASDFDIGRIEGVGYMEGMIDEVKIFNYALTATQVKTLYNENSSVRFGP